MFGRGSVGKKKRVFGKRMVCLSSPNIN